jgi:hypothetical protein
MGCQPLGGRGQQFGTLNEILGTPTEADASLILPERIVNPELEMKAACHVASIMLRHWANPRHRKRVALFSCRGLAETITDEGQFSAFRRAHDCDFAVPPVH